MDDRPEEFRGNGKHCYVEPIGKGLALKIFDAYPDVVELDQMKWGDNPKKDQPKQNVSLTDATIFQNYCWWARIAPRVYGIQTVKRNGINYWAQLTDYLEGDNIIEEVDFLYQKAKEVGETYGFQSMKDDFSHRDAVGDKLVDFNTFHPIDNRMEIIKKLYIEEARYGKIYYHNAFGLTNSPRSNENRIKWMGLHKLNWKGKSVLDIGCAGGAFLQYAKICGANTVIGVDNKKTLHGAFIAANEYRHWDIGFIAMDASKELPKEKFDIVLYLSMNFHIGIPNHLFDTLSKHGVLVIEDNAEDRNKIPLPDKLRDRFEVIKFMGFSKDHGNKPNYHCYGLKK